MNRRRTGKRNDHLAASCACGRSDHVIVVPLACDRTASHSVQTIAAEVPARSGWLVSPKFDLLVVANLLWPLALLPGFIAADGEPYLAYWAAYFIATPHRWMTIVLAGLDPDRRYGRGRLFLLIAIATAALIAAVWWLTGNFRPLALFYALIIGWHFGSQHSGILRMYSRKTGGIRWMEIYLPRVFILYASLRLMPGFDNLTHLAGSGLKSIDWVVLAIPAVMITVELGAAPLQRLSKLIYLTSVCGLYSSLILAAHHGHYMVAMAMLLTATIFHSTEYLAVVTHYARRRQLRGSPGAFQAIARRWNVLFPWYVITCGLIYTFGDQLFVAAWFAVNLWASILHCAYDGMMWKLRDPATAGVLDVEIRPGVSAADSRPWEFPQLSRSTVGTVQ